MMPMLLTMMPASATDDADGDVDEADDAIVIGVDVAVDVIVAIADAITRSVGLNDVHRNQKKLQQ